MKGWFCFFVGLVSCAGIAAGQNPRMHRVPVEASAPGAQHPKFKAIWEPINYPDDLSMMSVFFVSDDTGWVSGGSSRDQGGFILQTNDGGGHWTLQLGDPQSSDHSITELRFIDAKHGWAVQGDKLVRTSDGADWEDAGSLPPHIPLEDYAFTSATHGVFVGGFNGSASTIFSTHDGGQTWRQVFECSTKVEVNGLTRKTGCQLFAVSFPSPSLGYAVGGSYNDGPGRGFFVVAKTEDGGDTWSLVSSITNTPHAEGVYFSGPDNGTTRNRDAKFYLTTDGGATWKGATGSNDAGHAHPIIFVDDQVGWTSGEHTVDYTVDGGKHWYSRHLNLPARIEALSLASRQRAYLVGEHGMIYRYRVVPYEYMSKGMFGAPMMPAKNPN